ncbi:MAG: PIN domain-containing protein [Spirochaetaceae bacterium]|nr:MAG: PIN domain-containing protein [Spirochaetaceae bacterium]
MTVLLDTSALYAVFDRDDENHDAASRGWEELLATDARLITHNYVVLELTALLQHRLGIEAVRDLVVDILPVCAIQWVSEAIHAQALHRLLATGKRRLSLTDCVSFEMMRRNACDRAFAFDPHFEQQGFVTPWS